MVASVALRQILPSTAAAICWLHAEGSLPCLPGSLAWVGLAPHFRRPSLTEMECEQWHLCWQFGRPIGVLATLDRYDYPSASDVSELIHVAGTRRAVIDLVRFAAENARARHRRIVGSVANGNETMRAVLLKLGARETRVVFEAE